jgi:hypothetical protein
MNPLYDVLVTLDQEGGYTRELTDPQRRTLRKAVRLGYVEPSRFAASNSRPRVIAYAVTASGHDFISQVDDQAEIENGGPL